MVAALLGRGSTSETSDLSGLDRLKVDIQKVNESLYELKRPSGTYKMEIIFFHGLQFADESDAHLRTWESEDGLSLWPKWLAEMFPAARILFVAYDGSVRKSFDMHNIVEKLIADFMLGNIGQTPNCPVVLVGHYFGGLVIKELCLEADIRRHIGWESQRFKVAAFLENVKGVFFYDTPHHGIPGLGEVSDSQLLNSFKKLSKEASWVDFEFTQLRQVYATWLVESLGEYLPVGQGILRGVVAAPEETASKGDHFNLLAVDHRSSCKLRNIEDKRFYSLAKLVDIIARNSQRAAVAHRRYGSPSLAAIDADERTTSDDATVVHGPPTYLERRALVLKEKLIGRGILGMGGIGKTTLAKQIFHCFKSEGESDAHLRTCESEDGQAHKSAPRGDEDGAGVVSVSSDSHPKGRKMPSIPQDLYPAEEDLVYEEEILRNPFSLKLWWRYLQARREAPVKKRSILFERALKALPGSYKLWYRYLREKLEGVRGLPVAHSAFENVNNTFERALVTMHKMPRIWILYLQTLTEQKYLTRARRTFDRALCSLPVTQHDRIWELYVKFVGQPGIPIETSLRVYRRYLKFDPTHVEEFIDFLLASELWQEAAEKLAQVLNDETFQSVNGKSRHQLWLELCNLLTKHASEVSGLQVDAIIRGGIRRFSDEVGRLWTSLADYYIRRSLFEKARDIFEEGMSSVVTVRDFSTIFDAYAQFEESLLTAKIESLEANGEDEDGDGGSHETHHENGQELAAEEGIVVESKTAKDKSGKDLLDRWEKEILADFWRKDEDDIDLRLARFEHLMNRRPELVSSVLLRQNPHNVHEWHKRVKLFEGNPTRQILTYTEAVRTVDPFKAVGKPHTLWVAFAKLYEKHQDIVNAGKIFEKAVQVGFKAVDDLATVWCEWAEMLIRHKNFKGALNLMWRATTEPSFQVKRTVATLGEEPVQMRVYRSLKLWTFYVDLEESLGTLDKTRKLYERILDLKIATPQIILQYAYMLESNKYFEDAFKVYERGVRLFKYPHVREIWTTYLLKFVSRYGAKKLERARDLFEQAVEKVPPEDAKPLYLQYAKLEEDFGLARHAMAVYERATKSVADSEKMSIYEIYIARAAEFFGVPKTRKIYELAIQSGLPDKDVKVMCLKYAELERNLGEIDRARAIYVHAAQMSDPRSDSDFWSKWNNFEVQHGNEDTFREMLRIKRSVSASYNQMHFILPEYLMQRESGNVSLEEAVDTLKRAGVPEDEMAALERQIAPPRSPLKEGMRSLGFISGGVEEQKESSPRQTVALNPDEIELEEESEEEDGGVDISQKAVPEAVFGGLASKTLDGADTVSRDGKRDADPEEKLGAMARLKRQRQQ